MENKITSYRLVQGVQEKLCLFTIHCNPSVAYITVRDLQSSQRNACVQSLLLAGNFLYNVGIVMSPSMFSSSNGVYYVLIYLSMCLNLCTLLSNGL